VLRTRDLGEADRLLTLFSSERGKIAALAKGARRPRSKLAPLQLFSLSTLQLAVGKNLDIITQGLVRLPFLTLREDVTRFAYASYFAELTDVLTQPEERNRRLFDLAVSALSLLDRGVDPDLLARAFELHLLDLSGYAPEIEACVSCQQPLAAERLAFSPQLGGLLCPRCLPGKQGLLSLQREAGQGLKALRRLRRLADLQPEKMSLSPNAKREMGRLLHAQIAYHLDRKIKSLSLLDRLRRPGPPPRSSR